jgi:hypothetical protein
MDAKHRLRELSRKALLLDRLDKLHKQRKAREGSKKPVVVDHETTVFLNKAIATANKRAQTRKAGRRRRRTAKRTVH